ncbi:MAG: magnesium-translocating P-type ATPase [Acidimicrobiales bacterium]
MQLVDAATIDAAAVIDHLGSTDLGLTSAEAARRLAEAGPNVLASHRVTALGVLWRQLRNPLLLLLLGAAAVSGVTGDVTDAVIIATIVTLSVGLGFFNEYRSEQAANALRSNIRHTVVVWRDGLERRLPVADLVPGDVVDMSIGAIVPADVRLVDATGLQCDEAVLTGESLPVDKSVEPCVVGDSALDLPSCALMGTVVHQGGARAIVVATGSSTAFGRIATGLSERPPVTAFQSGLTGFSKLLVAVAAVLSVSIFVVNVVFARPLIDALLFSLAIAIGITPQLLPAIVSVSLSTGSRQLAKRQVLVKRLVTIEDLGNLEVLFTDKTGTLTEGAVTFDRAFDAGGSDAPRALLLGLLCNESTMSPDGPVGGNALDQAIVAAAAGGDAMEEAAGYRRLGSLPFDHDRQLASVSVADAGGAALLVTKGAPEVVLARCAGAPPSAEGELARLFEQGARVVAIASRPLASADEADPTRDDEHDLRFEGFLTFVDRPKADAGAAIHRLHDLGVHVKVITGDNGTVAATVCRQVGVEPGGVLTGSELSAMSDDELAAAIPTTTVFSRVSPDQKSRIIKVTRHGGTDVGFLGDGVNDAVALHSADVGISVDSATDVAKDAADIVLLAKDLGVLADGVVEGRRIFANTLKYVLMATSSNFGNMFSAAGASVFLSFLPMLPSQILLNNLLYDVGQLAVPTDHVDEEVLAHPAAWDIRFVRRFMTVFGPISSLFDFATFFVLIQLLHASHREFRTGWFVESLATQTVVIFLIRTRRIPFFRSRPSLPMLVTSVGAAAVGVALPFTPLASVLGFTALPLRFFLILSGMTCGYLFLIELAKTRFYRVSRHPERRRPTVDERHSRRVVRRVSHLAGHQPITLTRSSPLRAGGAAPSRGRRRSGS